MLRSLALAALFTLAATAATAAPAQQYRYSYRGDGFEASLWSGDECRSVNFWVYGADSFYKNGPGQPAAANYAQASVDVYDWCTQSWGWAWTDLTGAVVNARGPGSSSSVSGSMAVPMGHWEPGTEEVCDSWEENCWDDNWNPCDCAGECTYEYPAGEWCYYPEVWVSDGDALIGFNLTLTPEGTVYRGMNSGGSRSAYGMSRYRSNGTYRPATVSGTWVMDGRDLFATGGGYGNLWTTTGGELSIYRW